MWAGVATIIATNAGASWAKMLAFVVFVLPLILGMIIKLLGIAFVVYVGADIVIDTLSAQIFGSLNGLPAALLGLLQLAGLDTALKMIFSTASAVLTLKAVGRGRKIKLTPFTA